MRSCAGSCGCVAGIARYDARHATLNLLEIAP